MYLGVEIGGTKLQAGLGDGDGVIDHLSRVRAEPEAGREGVCRQIVQIVTDLLSRADSTANDVATVGIGFGGPVDSARGLVLTSHQVTGWDDFPIVDWWNSQTGLHAVLGNDSDLAGLAEAHFGAGQGLSPVVYMNIGSGIGGAVVADGELWTGQGVGAAEIGHLRILAESEDARLPWKTLEDLASGWSLAKAARRTARDHPDSLLAQMARSKELTTEDLIAAVRQGDAKAQSIWSDAVQYLGVAVANVVTLLHPRRVVIGGGVALVGDLLFEPLGQAVGRQVFAPFSETFDIVPASLGEQVVVHGALKLARDASGRQG